MRNAVSEPATVSTSPAEGAVPQPNRGTRRRYVVTKSVLEWLRWSWLGTRAHISINHRLDWAIAHVNAQIVHRQRLADATGLAQSAFAVPFGESVRIPGLFVVELFPPSESGQLQHAAQRHGWPDPPTDVRSQRQWNLGTFAATRRVVSGPHTRQAKLPREFNEITLTAVQIGEGITAVVAAFHMTDAAARHVSDVWHRDHQPEIVRGRGERPRSEAAQSVAVRRTQIARQSMHDAARRWLARTCPGFFAANDEPQPLIDLMLFTRRRATLDESPTRPDETSYRALGLTDRHVIHTSSNIPAMTLERAPRTSHSYVDGVRTWALWGQRHEIVDQAIDFDVRSPDDEQAIVDYIGAGVRNHLTRLALSELLSVYHARYADMRDSARNRRGLFHTKHLEELRTSLLVLSLNVGSLERDIKEFNESGLFSRDDSWCTVTAPWVSPQTPVNTTELMIKEQSEMLTQLVLDDEQFRVLLSAAVSLTSSIEGLRASRLAKLIAAASLSVSLAMVLCSDVAEHPRFNALVSWLIHLG
ncbi:hypothetical protein [Mycobacterium sp. URHB0044]|uniref:hypothetical protein n=1 Tax=Mycobacterium sp. URHB0044 TaxID=1380386 RepID=UPI000A7AF714|nr:hypothetical protein [Mycobacterium sp. URHB0044]